MPPGVPHVAPLAAVWDLHRSPMAPREPAPITPTVLRWAREVAGYRPDDVAEKLKVTRERVLAWESGEESLSVSRLDRTTEA